MSNELTEKVKQNAQKNEVAKVEGAQSIFDLVKKMGPQFAMALPKHINSERFLRISLTCLRNNPKLAQCSAQSFMAALMQSAQAGLEPSTLGQCFILPFKGEAKLIYGYQGLLTLVRRSGEIKDIYAEIIYENDTWDITLGLEKNIVHKPLLTGEDRGKPIIVYSVAVFANGSRSFDFMTAADVQKVKNASPSANFSDSPWKNWTDSMWKKTILKRHSKILPLSVEIAAQMAADETIKTKIAMDMTEVPSEEIVVTAEDIDSVPAE